MSSDARSGLIRRRRAILTSLASGVVLATCLALACAGILATQRAAGRIALRQSLWYTERGMTNREKEAVRRSKQLAHNVRLEQERNPTLVQRFMNAYANAKLAMREEYDYKIKPWASSHGLKSSRTSQLKVVMSECVKCVSECPAYVKHPIKASTFEEFSHVAKQECGMCYEGVKGPCPANIDNHGVLRVAQDGATQLHSMGAMPNPAKGEFAVSPYTKEAYPWSMGTNQVFLRHTNKAMKAQAMYE